MTHRKSHPKLCRLLVDTPADGTWNMAVDEALLDSAAEEQVPTLRIYRWRRPTLSLGYFQEHAQRQSHGSSLQADLVRRLSGGGAILHDQEITYSLVLPGTHSLATETQMLYDKVHCGIVEWLAQLISANRSSGRLMLCQQPITGREQPFLCFQRRSLGDVLLTEIDSHPGDHKIVGSAQRRRRGSVLQHGSLLWATTPAAPEVFGFTNLTCVSTALDEAAMGLVASILRALSLSSETTRLTSEMVAKVEKICAERYNLSAWTERH